MRSRLLIFALSAVVALIVPSLAAARAARPTAGTPVPYGFVGVVANGPLMPADSRVDLAHQLDLMVASGVDTVRVTFDWAAAQPVKSMDQIPSGLARDFASVNGVPTRFKDFDQIVGLAADRHMTVLPLVLYAPDWDARKNPTGYSVPKRPGPYADFLTALIKRYGPHGTFWAGRRGARVPIRAWQIWNEPNLSYSWPQPFAGGYVSLLRAVHTAVKRADPGAKVVLGALTNFAWKALGQLQHVSGARNLFDVLAVNGFTATPARVLEYLRLFRRAANALGDRDKPLLATEVSWTSSKRQTKQQFSWSTTEAGQASNIRTVLPMLAAQRRALGLAGFYYYTWAGPEFRGAPAFNFAGLFKFSSSGQFVAKPAYNAFRTAALALEGCRAKVQIATRCQRR